MELILTHLVVLAGIIATMCVAYFAWVISGVGNMAVKDSLKNWSWKRFRTDLLKFACFAVSMMACSICSDVLAYYVSMLEVDVLNAAMEVVSWGVIVGIPMIATYYLLYRSLNNNKSLVNYNAGLKLIGADKDVVANDDPEKVKEIAENVEKVAGQIFTFFATPVDLAKKHKKFEQEGGRGAYYSIDITSYDTFRNATLGKGFDVDSAYDYQCLTKDHAILMADGTYKLVQDIQEGDLVLANDGKTVNTIISAKTKRAPIYETNTHTGYFSSTADHKVLVNGVFKEVKELSVGDIIDEAHIDGINLELTPDEYRMLGFWLGDGWKKYRWANSATAEIGIRVCTDADETYIRGLNIAGLNFKNDGHGYAMFTKETKQKHPKLCQVIYDLKDKALPILSAGYAEIIDGFNQADGDKHNVNSDIVISNTNKPLLLSIQYGARQLGWQTKMSRPLYRGENDNCYANAKPIWKLYINRGPKREKQYGKVLYSVETEEDDIVYVINVDGDNTYIADNLLHHNCWDLCAVLWQQFGQSLLTGNGCAYGCWTLKREVNRTPNFTLITNKADVKRGDVVVFGGGEFGHIGFADEDYTGGTYIRLLGQNQGGAPGPKGMGGKTNVVNVSMGGFLGAFRYNRWATKPATPTPTTTTTTKPAETPSKPIQNAHKGFDIGDKVVPTKKVDAFGAKLTQYDPVYTITGFRDDVGGAILSARNQIWAVMPLDSIKKA